MVPVNHQMVFPLSAGHIFRIFKAGNKCFAYARQHMIYVITISKILGAAANDGNFAVFLIMGSSRIDDDVSDNELWWG